LGIVTTSSETAFSRSPEVIYDFVTNPVNWTKTYPTAPTSAACQTPDGFLRMVNPANIDAHHAAIARELGA
jgi:hypothetical protein